VKVEWNEAWSELEEVSEFSPLEPIQAWIDLLSSGVKPWEVRILGINGGAISAFEYRMALSFGSTAGIVKSSGRSAADLQSDSEWWDAPNLLWLPKDEMALRAFVDPSRSTLRQAQLERVGEVIHTKYLQENRYKSIDPAMMPWEELREDLKESNRLQVDYAEKILRTAGYSVWDAEGMIEFPVFSMKEIEKMAVMEHGRWIVERLRAGWRYGPHRRPKEKMSPYLTPWNELPDEVKEYDRIVIREYPEVLAKAGLEVVKVVEDEELVSRRNLADKFVLD